MRQILTVISLIFFVAACNRESRVAEDVAQNKQDFQNAEMVISVSASHSNWTYHYLKGEGAGTQFHSLTRNLEVVHPVAYRPHPDDVINELVVPENKKILFLLTSHGEAASWSVPALGISQNAMPHVVTKAWGSAEKPGVYPNEGHAVPSTVRVVSAGDYTAWLEKRKRKAELKASLADTAVRVGRVEILLPAPAGFARIRHDNPEYKAFETAARNSRLLAVFLPAETSGSQEVADRNFVLLSPTKDEADLGAEEFNRRKDLARSEGHVPGDQQKSRGEELLRNARSKTDAGKDSPVFLGVIHETPYSITSGSIQRIVKPGEADQVRITTSTRLLQNRKYLNIVSTAPYRGEADVQSVAAQIKSWLEQIDFANRD